MPKKGAWTVWWFKGGLARKKGGVFLRGVDVCMYVCMYVCVYVCMYVYMYVFMYACMYVRIPDDNKQEILEPKLFNIFC